MKLLKLCWLPFLLMAMFLGGCSQSNEDDVKSAKRFEELNALPVDTLLYRAFAFYKQINASKDSVLQDSMNVYRNLFFARWSRSSDSICATIPADDSLAADLREINAAVIRYLANHENYRAASLYFVQDLKMAYRDSSYDVADDSNKTDRGRLLELVFNIGESMKATSACMNRTPMGQKVLVLSEEYEKLLNRFMKANVQGSTREDIDVRKSFWQSLIVVRRNHRGVGFHFESFPTVSNVIFEASHDVAKVSVRKSFHSGGMYDLSKSDGKWNVVGKVSHWMN